MDEQDQQVRALLELLQQIQVHLQANLHEQAKAMGLTVAQSSVTRDIAEHPGTTLQAVCDRLGWPKSTVSRLVEELVQHQIATRRIPPENRRTVLLDVSITSGPHCLPAPVNALLKGWSGPLEPRQANELLKSLERILVLVKG